MADPVLPAESVAGAADGVAAVMCGAEVFQMPYAFYPHYWSTYCVHHRHSECRLTCKTCDAPCLCVCHKVAPPPDPETGP